MKKIMFNDTYGLTTAVLQRRKTKTRRSCKDRATNELILAADVESYRYYPEENLVEFLMRDGSVKVSVPPYKIGEVVAVAQSYKNVEIDVFDNEDDDELHIELLQHIGERGWTNKMFVRADLMPHQIRITDIKIERLQDIGEEDCLKEGIVAGELKHEHPKELVRTPMPYGCFLPFSFIGADTDYYCAKDAFATLIDKVSGKGTWEFNPYVFAYSFELVK